MTKSFIILFIAFLSFASAGYTYEDLKVKDYEQMRKIINVHIQKTQKIVEEMLGDKAEKETIDPEEALSELKQGLKVLFMRPDTDGLRSSLLRPLEAEISTYKPFVHVLTEIVRETLPILKNKKSSVILQASALYIIENSISHAMSIQSSDADVIFSDIKKSKIKISDKITNHFRFSEGRGQTASPSHIAKKILKKRLKKRAIVEKRARIAARKAAIKQARKAKKKKAEDAKKKKSKKTQK